MKHLILSLGLVSVCFSLQDIENAGRESACMALCKRDGYTAGIATGKGCACIDSKPVFEDYMHRRMNLGPRPDVPFLPENKSKDVTFKVNPEGYFGNYDE